MDPTEIITTKSLHRFASFFNNDMLVSSMTYTKCNICYACYDPQGWTEVFMGAFPNIQQSPFEVQSSAQRYAFSQNLSGMAVYVQLESDTKYWGIWFFMTDHQHHHQHHHQQHHHHDHDQLKLVSGSKQFKMINLQKKYLFETFNKPSLLLFAAPNQNITKLLHIYTLSFLVPN